MADNYNSGFGTAFAAGLGSSLAGIPGAVVAAGLNVAGSMYAQKRAEENQRKVNEQNRAWQLEDRKHDELYNSPAMQKARMVDAGIGGDYSQLVSPFATQSNTAVGSAPQNALGALGSLGNTASAAFSDAMATGMNYATNSAEYELRKAQAVTEARKAEQLEIENRWKPILNALDEKLGNAELVSKNLDIENKTISNYVAEGLKDSTVRLGQLQVESAEVRIEGDRIQNVGFKLSNDLTSVEIEGKKFDLNNIAPLKVEELQKSIALLGDEHEKNGKILTGLDYVNQAAAYELFGARLKALVDEDTYNAIVANHDRYVQSIDKQIKGEIRNRNYDNSRFNTGGWRDFNRHVEKTADNVQSTAKSWGASILGAAVLKGFGRGFDAFSNNPEFDSSYTNQPYFWGGRK